jgi:hypothetical protein
MLPTKGLHVLDLKRIDIQFIHTEQGENVGDVESQYKSMYKVCAVLKVAHVRCVLLCFKLHPSCLR